MRWDPLFDDLASQADAAAEADADAEAAELTRHAWGQRTVVERLRAATGSQVRCRGAGGLEVTGIVHQVGPDWLLLARAPTQWVLLAVGALTVVDGVPHAADLWVRSPVDAANTTRAVLGQLCRARRAMQITTTDGLRLVGTLMRVGADHVDLARHPLDEQPRSAVIQGVSVIALRAITSLEWQD